MIEPQIIQGDARNLHMVADASVDLIVTSPPYFGLRDYGHADQLGAEPTPAEYIAALVECTREMVRVLKPSGSIFVNLGDKYRPTKSLGLLPERYRIACTDELGLIARAVLVWSKPNGLPESVTDRVRRSHEDWVHLTKSPKYFAAVDEIREPYEGKPQRRFSPRSVDKAPRQEGQRARTIEDYVWTEPQAGVNPLGKLPGSVWEIATQPLRVPAELGIDHFAAFPMEWPRRLILGWSPREVCTACGEGRRPQVLAERHRNGVPVSGALYGKGGKVATATGRQHIERTDRTITGYACACPDNSAPATPGVVLDPFGGTGTTALVAAMHGRQGISVDASTDYCRLAQWRVNDPKQRERAARPAGSKPSARRAAHFREEDALRVVALGVAADDTTGVHADAPAPVSGEEGAREGQRLAGAVDAGGVVSALDLLVGHRDIVQPAGQDAQDEEVA